MRLPQAIGGVASPVVSIKATISPMSLQVAYRKQLVPALRRSISGPASGDEAGVERSLPTRRVQVSS